MSGSASAGASLPGSNISPTIASSPLVRGSRAAHRRGQVAADLKRLAGEAEPVMVCWEHPPPSPSWCHRALVSAWLFKTIGVAVPEVGHEDAGFGWQHPKLHPTLKDFQ